MSRLSAAWRALVDGPKEPQPKTKIMPGQDEKNPYARYGLGGKEDRREKIKRFLKAYRRGGPAADAIDTFPLFVLSNGYTLTCEEGQDHLKEMVQDWLDQPHVDLEAWIWEGVTSAVLAGDAYQELVMARGGQPWGLVTRDPSMFSKDFDDKGRVTGYTQHVPNQYGIGTAQEIPIPKESIINLVLFRAPGDVYGQSIWDRAEDDILRDLDVIESLTKAIHRHGTPKQQWAVGSEESPASESDLDEIEDEIKRIDAKTDFATTHDVQINALDTSGVANADTYNNVTLGRMACAMGVPEEMLGLGRGSTEATATVRLKTFYDKITTIQSIVARTYNRRLIDVITNAPGMVWIEFNDVSPQDELQKAQWIALLRQGMDPDAIVPAEWAREQFGIPVDDDLGDSPNPVLLRRSMPGPAGEPSEETMPEEQESIV